MIGPLGPEPDARSIHATGVLVWVASSALEGILPPHCVHAIFPHAPAIASQQSRHRAVPIPPVRLSQCDDPRAELLSIVIRPRPVPLSGPNLSNHPTRSTVGHTEHRHGVLHSFAPTGRA